MISTKKLIKMARKWQKLATAGRRRVLWPRSAADKGHFAVYTTDARRFMIPITYLKNEIVSELFRLAEEEFGVASDRPIVLPCDSVFMEYAISMIQRQVAKELEKALVASLSTYKCSWLSHENHQNNLQLCIHSF
ncbi:Auxin-responsive protein SAUR61 [Bienertia sinuspersici]